MPLIQTTKLGATGLDFETWDTTEADRSISISSISVASFVGR